MSLALVIQQRWCSSIEPEQRAAIEVSLASITATGSEDTNRGHHRCIIIKTEEPPPWPPDQQSGRKDDYGEGQAQCCGDCNFWTLVLVVDGSWVVDLWDICGACHADARMEERRGKQSMPNSCRPGSRKSNTERGNSPMDMVMSASIVRARRSNLGTVRYGVPRKTSVVHQFGRQASIRLRVPRYRDILRVVQDGTMAGQDDR